MTKYRFCICCGSELTEEQLYCPNCGSAVAHDTGTPAQSCPNCKAKYADENDCFCRYCGAKRPGAEKHFSMRIADMAQPVYGPMPASDSGVCPICGLKWKRSIWSRKSRCRRCGNELL